MHGESRQPGLTAYVTAVVGLGACALTFHWGSLRSDLVGAAWFFACLLGESLWFQTPTRRGTISLGLPLDLAALIILPAGQALAIIAASTFLAALYPHRRDPVRALFNSAQSVVAGWAALMILKLLAADARVASIMPHGTSWVALYAGGFAFFLVNSTQVAGAIALSTRAGLWSTLRANFIYGFELAATVAQISLAGFLVMADSQLGPLVVLAMLPVLAVLWWSSLREANRQADRAGEKPGRTTEPGAGPPDDRRAA